MTALPATHPRHPGTVMDLTTRPLDLSFRPLDPAADATLLHRWLSMPRARFWMMTEHTPAQVRTYLDQVACSAHEQGWIGMRGGEPLVYVETYDPALLLPAGVLEPEPGDLGMHLLVAPPEGESEHGLTTAVMGAVVRWCLHGRGAARIVVEPDERNTAVLAKNAAAGFRVLRTIELGSGAEAKRAALSVCTRADHAASLLGAGADPLAHLGAEVGERVHRQLLAKAIAEFRHERMLTPEPDGSTEGSYRITARDGAVRWTFTARELPLEHWLVDPASIRRHEGGAETRLDVLDLVLDLQEQLGLPEELASTYLEELSSTFAARCATLAEALEGGRPTSTDLLSAGLEEIEAAMTEGHPGFVATNGRIGYGLADYRAFAPEQGRRTRLQWVALRRELGHLALGEGLDEQAHLDAALSPEEREVFAARLRSRGLDPQGYHYLPLHPWQADHRLAITFAADVARGDLVPLGEGGAELQPQQSLRTFLDRTRPGAPYVKTALAIQNMGFLRGLSPAYMRDTPAINDWLARLVAGDAEFARCGVSVLRERAAIGYTGDAYHRTASSNPHRKMLAALWRESPLPLLEDGERAFTMAALLHRDHEGRSYAGALIHASGITPADWVTGYLRAYLRPLAHLLLAHDTVVMPHGENIILRVRDQQVVGAFLKDIGEEMAVLGERELPRDVERIRALVGGEEKALSIFTDVFDGVLRHLSGILDADGLLGAEEFWGLVGQVLDAYEADHPDLARGIGGDVDLRAGSFAHSCLNRLQLRNTLQMVDLGDQASSLLYAGRMENPVARRGAVIA